MHCSTKVDDCLVKHAQKAVWSGNYNLTSIEEGDLWKERNADQERLFNNNFSINLSVT